MQWGMFWQKISFNARKLGSIIQAGMLLHNFIVHEWEELSSGETIERRFFENFVYDNLVRNA